MPQLSDTFDAYPISIILDGSGNGVVQFQPNGCNVSISRLFVQVATSVKQATVTLFKGTLNQSSAIGTIVSGSTGGLASGQIFLTDGQTLYVQWTGGDAAANATVTFSGRKVGFSEIGGDSLTWTDPIAASDGSLVFPAIKSPNFQAGVQGWSINRNGSVEFSDATIRGSISADSGNIALDSTGIHVIGTTRRFDISKTSGYVARTIPSNGQQSQLVDSGIFFTPPTPTGNGNAIAASQIFASVNTNGTVDSPQLIINGNNITGKNHAAIVLQGQSSNSGTDNSVMQLFAPQIVPISDNSLQDNNHHYYLRGENQAFTTSLSSGATSASIPVTFTHAFSAIPNVVCTIEDPSTAMKPWIARPINVTATGFTFFMFPTTGAGLSGNTVPRCTWVATEYTP